MAHPTKELYLSGLLILLAAYSLGLQSCGVRRQFNEDRALGATETIRIAEADFKSKNGRFATSEELKRSYSGIPGSVQNGYKFRLEAADKSFSFYATPTEYKEKSLSFYLDESGVIRGMFKNGLEATVEDPPLLGPGINPGLTPH